MKNQLNNFLPEGSYAYIQSLLEKHPCLLKIVPNRTTKHGDFRQLKDGRYQITVNNSLNEYQFLLTLVHEIAHLTTYKKHKNIKPHGIEWKQEFKQLMLPLLTPSIYPNELLPLLAKYLINAKASTDSDIDLSKALKKYNNPELRFISDLENGNHFIFRNREFKILSKKRTRFVCLDTTNKKRYLISANAEISTLLN